MIVQLLPFFRNFCYGAAVIIIEKIKILLKCRSSKIIINLHPTVYNSYYNQIIINTLLTNVHP